MEEEDKGGGDWWMGDKWMRMKGWGSKRGGRGFVSRGDERGGRRNEDEKMRKGKGCLEPFCFNEIMKIPSTNLKASRIRVYGSEPV